MTQTSGSGADPKPPATPALATTTTSDPPKKKIVLTKIGGARWTVKYDGAITRRDIAHLTRLIRIEFLRSKRKDRLERRKADRAKEIKE